MFSSRQLSSRQGRRSCNNTASSNKDIGQSLTGPRRETNDVKGQPLFFVISAALVGVIILLHSRPDYYYSLDTSILPAIPGSRKSSVDRTPSFSCSTIQRTDVDYFHHKENKKCNKDMQVPNEGFMFEKRYIFSKFEKAVTNVFHDVLGTKSTKDIDEGIVLDIGGNTGWFSNLAAFCYGVKVHIFEPQPDCFRVICPLFRTNGVENLITTHNNFVSNQKDMTLTLNTGAGCDPGFSPPKRSVDGGLITVSPINPTDWFMDEENVPILLVKIDVEGNELDVLNALSPLIESKRINDIVMEVNPKHYGKNDEYEQNLSVYDRYFFSQGFRAYHLEGNKEYLEFSGFKKMMGAPTTQRGGGNIHFSRKE